jgi:predicted nucleic acid-binding protein
MRVIDASVLVAYLTGGEASERARELFAAGREQLFAPHLIDAETGHALRRLAAAGAIDEEVAGQALTDVANLTIQRTPHTWLLDFAWELRSSFSFYDALYLALARELELPFVTLDVRLARTARKLPIEVEVPSD